MREEQLTLEDRKLAAYRQARIFEPSMEGYGAAMAVYAAAFPDEPFSQVDLFHIGCAVAATPVAKQRDLLRAALVRLVGADGRAELEQMELAIRTMPAPAEDKAATIDAIHALITTGGSETE